MELTFTFKKPKEVKAEKYPNTPVLTYLGGNGVSKFGLNKKALELLMYKDGQITGQKVSFGPFEDTLFIANTSVLNSEQAKEAGITQANLNLTNDFNSGKLLERMCKTFRTLIPGDEFILVENKPSKYPYLVVTNNTPNGSYTKSDFSEVDDKEFDEEEEVEHIDEDFIYQA